MSSTVKLNKFLFLCISDFEDILVCGDKKENAPTKEFQNQGEKTAPEFHKGLLECLVNKFLVLFMLDRIQRHKMTSYLISLK